MMHGVTEGMIVGSSTEVIAGEKMIITAGAIDAHVHYICVDLWREVSRISRLVHGASYL
jgi:urease